MSNWSDFTEVAYKKLLTLAGERYRFINYSNDLEEENVILWRHDVDFSVHRALRLAQIENDLGVASTFFIRLESPYYNAFESNILDKLQQIICLGHQIGLHFNPSLYKNLNKEMVMQKMTWKKTILQELLGKDVIAVSFHNPDVGDWLSVDQHILCGMVNAYSNLLKTHFGYCSDSNGYWRFDSIESVLRKKKHSRLQVLTHPCWWIPEPLPPRKRIKRCIDGRASRNMDDYDNALFVNGRENIDD